MTSFEIVLYCGSRLQHCYYPASFPGSFVAFPSLSRVGDERGPTGVGRRKEQFSPEGGDE